MVWLLGCIRLPYRTIERLFLNDHVEHIYLLDKVLSQVERALLPMLRIVGLPIGRTATDQRFYLLATGQILHRLLLAPRVAVIHGGKLLDMPW